jgi:glutamate formiminotransferase/formiminotetrahydrofolate cyclodeaminase
VHGAWLNVRINACDIEDKAWVEAKLSAAQSIAAKADALEQEVIGLVERHVG